MSSAGQVIGLAVGAIVGVLVAPAGAAILSYMLAGASIGMTIGTLIDPPDVADPSRSVALQEDIQFNTYQRNLPVPVLYNEYLISGNVMFIGKSEMFEVVTEYENVRTGATTTTTREITEWRYDLDFIVAITEGVLDNVSQVLMEDQDITEFESQETAGQRTIAQIQSELWEWKNGAMDQILPEYKTGGGSQIADGGIAIPVPWRNTAYVLHHGDIDTQPRVPTYTILAQRWNDMIQTTTGSHATISDEPYIAFYDWYSEQFYYLTNISSDGVFFMSRTGGTTEQPFPPVWSTATLKVAGYFGYDDVLLLQNPNTPREFALGSFGSDDWEIFDTNNSTFETMTVDAYHADTWNGNFYTAHRDSANDEVVVQRMSVVTKAIEGCVIPIASFPSGYTITGLRISGIYYDAEMGYVYLGIELFGGGENAGIVRFPWGRGKDPEPARLDTHQFSGITDIVGVGVSGDLAFTVDPAGDRVLYYDFFEQDEFDTESSSIIWSSGRPSENFGYINTVTQMTYCPEQEKMILVDDGLSGTDWSVVMCQWDGLDWSWIRRTDHQVKKYERPGDPAGVIRDAYTHTLYGPGAPETFLDLKWFELYSGYCGAAAFSQQISGNRYQSRWSISAHVVGRVKIKSFIDEILTSTSGLRVESGGKLRTVPDRAAGRVIARFVDNDFKPGTFVLTSTDRLERPNKFTISYRRADDRYRPDFVEDSDEFDIDQSGETREREISASYVTEGTQAARYALRLKNQTMGNRRIIAGTIGHVGMILDQGDLIGVTHDVAGISNLIFRIISIDESDKEEYRIEAREFIDTDYDLSNPPKVQPPDIGIAGQVTIDTIDGPARPGVIEDLIDAQMNVIWSRTDEPGPLIDYVVERKLSSESEYRVIGRYQVTTESYIIEDLTDVETDVDGKHRHRFHGGSINLPTFAYIGSTSLPKSSSFNRNEIVKVTALNDSTVAGTMTITRGELGTDNIAHTRHDYDPNYAQLDYPNQISTFNVITPITTPAQHLTFCTAPSRSLYIGSTSMFNCLKMTFNTVASQDVKLVVELGILATTRSLITGNPVNYLKWERAAGVVDGTLGLTQAGDITWHPPANWINASTAFIKKEQTSIKQFFPTFSGFWMRIRRVLDQPITTDPVETRIWCSQIPYLTILSSRPFVDEIGLDDVGKIFDYKIAPRAISGASGGSSRYVTLQSRPIVGYGLKPPPLADAELRIDNDDAGGRGTTNVVLATNQDITAFWAGSNRVTGGYGQGPYGGISPVNAPYGGGSGEAHGFNVKLFWRALVWNPNTGSYENKLTLVEALNLSFDLAKNYATQSSIYQGRISARAYNIFRDVGWGNRVWPFAIVWSSSLRNDWGYGSVTKFTIEIAAYRNLGGQVVLGDITTLTTTT